MADDTIMTVTGYLTADPTSGRTEDGPWVSFTLVSVARVFDRTTKIRKPRARVYFRCYTWAQLAANAAKSLHKSVEVTVTGKVRQQRIETTDGAPRSVTEIKADVISVSLRDATVTITPNADTTGGKQDDRASGDETAPVTRAPRTVLPRTRVRASRMTPRRQAT